MSELNLETILLDVQNNVGIITLNNAPLNVLNRQLLQDLDSVLSHIEENKEIKVIVVTGAGKAFAAGADIKAMPALNGQTGEELALRGQAVCNKLERMDKLSIAAVNGVALGGGLELAMSCDIRFMAENAKVGQPEINLGIIPGYGGTQRLTRLVGKPRAKMLVLGGDSINAQEAFTLGLADKVLPDEELLKTTVSFAEKVASKGQVAVKYGKKAIDEGIELNLEEALKLEAKYFGAVCATEDKNEGVTAFMEKRKAVFKDR